MFCPNCGTKLPDEAMFCANCGTKLQAAPVYEEPTVTAPVFDEPATARPVATAPEAPVHEPVSARPAPQPVTERPVIVREPVSARPAPQPVTERPSPAPKAPAAPVEAELDGDVVAPADYTTVNVILMIVSILSCCSCVSIISFITSLIGVISGSGCKKAIAAGDLAAAEKKGKTAKIMWVISAVLLALAILFGAIVLILSFVGNSFDPTSIVDQVMSEIQ